MPDSPDPASSVAATQVGADPKTGDRIGPYEVLRSVGRGGMATVLAVRDTRNDAVVGMKLLLPMQMEDEARSRFRQEFKALLRLDHPNVLRVYEWGLLGDRPWFSMELLEGHDLREEVLRLAEAPPAERFAQVSSILKQVARALAYVHDRGLIHRDVTPGNIHIDATGRTRLMDFGVVKENDSEHTAVGELIGTVAYMSPEQIQGHEPNSKMDLYSLGTVLYLLLTGQKVFSAHTLHGFMEKHLNEAPRPPRQLDPSVPIDLEEVCLRLLRKDPTERFASASHLLHALGERVEDDIDEGWPPRTVGRTPVKARLYQALERVEKGQSGGAFLLSGALGFGKTRTLQMVENWSGIKGVRFAAGSARQDDRPFGAFTGIYRDLKGEAPSDLLRDVFEGNSERAIERFPVFAEFRDLLENAAPCVIALDDVEHLDPASLELTAYLLRNSVERSIFPILVVLGIDAGASRTRSHLENLSILQQLNLTELAAAEVEELVFSVVRPSAATTALATRLHKESGGSPAFIIDMLRGLIDDGRIVEQNGGLELAVEAAEITRSRLPMPASLRQALKERLAPLSDEALTIGRTLAVSRRRVPLDVLIHASGLAEEDIMMGLDDLLDAGIVEETHAGEEDLVGLAHGRFRDVLLERVDATQLTQLHLKLGTTLESHYRASPGIVVAELAWQFEQGQIPTKAYSYLIRTANQHLNRSSYEDCLVYLDRALQLEPEARPLMLLDEADRQLVEVHLSRAQARFNIGMVDEALQATREAHTIATTLGDPHLLSRVSSQLGNHLRQHGHNEEAAPYLERALEFAKESGNEKLVMVPMYELGGIHWSRGDLEKAESYWKQSLAIATRVGDRRAQGHGYNGLGILALCQGRSMEARRFMEQSAQVFSSIGMLGPLTIAQINLVEIYLNAGLMKKALTLADATLERCKEANQLQGIALALAWRANVLLSLNQIDLAMEDALNSLRRCRDLGAREEEVLALSVRTRIHFQRQDYPAALTSVQELIPLLERHDHEGIAPQVTAWHVRALAGMGRRPAATAVLASGRPNPEAWPHIRTRSMIALGRAMILLKRNEQARDHFLDALHVAEQAGFRYMQLLAHNELCRVESDDSAQSRHDRVARAMARSISANLSRDMADRFLARGWGSEPSR